VRRTVTHSRDRGHRRHGWNFQAHGRTGDIAVLQLVEIFQPRSKSEPSLDTRIHYLIAYDTVTEGATPFRGFQFAPLRNSDILQTIAALPSDVRQFAYVRQSSFGFRAIGMQPLRI